MSLRLLVFAFGLLAACSGDGKDSGDSQLPVDGDGDGVNAGEDCDDADATVSPLKTETCDGKDDDCDGDIDENGTTDGTVYFADTDADGYGDPTATVIACATPDGYVADDSDCDDTRAAVNPSVVELCNDIDDNCTGGADEAGAQDAATWYADVDGDGFGDAASTTEACTAPFGYTGDATDCDDTTAAVSPGASETCNGVDDDCDGGTDDDATDATPWYRDSDGDGYGDANFPVVACEPPAGYVGNYTDCDDTDGHVNAEGVESCDLRDDDCDGETDEAGALGEQTWYRDADGDGYGDASSPSVSCSAAHGEVADATDCDDATATSHPGAAEACDGVDNDCDGASDEPGAAGETTWYADADHDGYGDPAVSAFACDAPTGYLSDATDCDDADAASHPGAVEICDFHDDDCDGTVDDGFSYTYPDADGDGFGDASAHPSCSSDVTNADDCDDASDVIYPGAVELCDGQQNDCDLTGWTASDEDGIVSAESPAGGWTDWTATFNSGTDASPAIFSLPTSGTLMVCDGTYFVNLTAGSGDLTIEALNPGSATLDGAAAGNVIISPAGGTLTIDGLTITNGDGNQGGGLYVDGGTVSVSDTDIVGNYASYGGGVYVTGSAAVTITGSSLDSNDARFGAGAYLYSGSLALSDSDVVANYASYAGGGLAVIGGSLTLTDTLVEDNTAYEDGGGLLLDGGTATCAADSGRAGFLSNLSYASGGAIAMATSTTYRSSGCDYGEPESTEDNAAVTSGADLYTYSGNTYAYGDDATFSCSGGSCS